MSRGLKEALEGITGAYYEEAPEDATYPYMVFSMRRLSESGGRQDYILEVNAWDQYGHYSRAECLIDRLEEGLHGRIHEEGRFLIRIFRGPRQNVPDPDRDIKRVREQFEMQVYDKETQ